MGLTYEKAGVKVKESEEFKSELASLVSETLRPEVLSDMSAFCSLFALPGGYKDPVLASATDGVGTKCLVAEHLDDLSNLGQDVVAMCVNDLITVGATPLFFLDYIATEQFERKTVEALVRSIAKACRVADCALVGGETAQMPGVYAPGHFDLAGFVVGVVERAKMLGPHRVQAGDQILGLPSNGLHANGFSLVRAILGTEDGDEIRNIPTELNLVEELLRPTRLYVKEMSKIKDLDGVHAAAHITGGGLPKNIIRVLPDGHQANLEKSNWQVSPIFEWLAERGDVDEEEMFRTFNMGIGFVVIAAYEAVDNLVDQGFSLIGSVQGGKKAVKLT